jgi:hypothetical protein
MPEPSSGNAFSFDENTFAGSEDGPITSANPLPDPQANRPASVPPVPPSSPTVADDRFGSHLKQPGSEPRMADRVNEPPPVRQAPPMPAPAPAASDANREPLLQRLRDRAKNLSPDRLSALARR